MNDQDMIICELQHKESKLEAKIKELVKVKEELLEVLSLAQDPTHNPRFVADEISLIKEREVEMYKKSRTKTAIVGIELEYTFDGKFSTEEIIDKLNNEANQQNNLPTNYKQGSFKVMNVQRFNEEIEHTYEKSLEQNIRNTINE